MKNIVAAPIVAAVLLVSGCADASPQTTPIRSDTTAPVDPTPPVTGTSTTQDPGPTAPPSDPSAPSPSPTRAPSTTRSTTAQPALGKPLSYVEQTPYSLGALPQQWSSGIGWYALPGDPAEVIGDLTAFVQRDAATTQDRTLVVTDSAGDVLYHSPSLGLKAPQSVEPSLNRVRQNGKEFITFYQIGLPASEGTADAEVPVAQLIVVDGTGKATVVDEDVTHYRPASTADGSRALAFTPTDGSLGMQSGVAAGPDTPGFVRVLNAETGTLEPIPEIEGQSWLARIDGVDVYRSPGSIDPESGKPVATAGTREWSVPFYDQLSGSITFGPTYMSVRKIDGSCEIVDLHSGEPLQFEGAAQGCAYETTMLKTFESASSPDGELFLMHWRDDQDADEQWVVDLKTGEQERIDPASGFQPTSISNAGDVYGRHRDSGAPGRLTFPDQMEPEYFETEVDLPTAINDQGVGMFKYEDLPTYFAVPAG